MSDYLIQLETALLAKEKGFTDYYCKAKYCHKKPPRCQMWVKNRAYNVNVNQNLLKNYVDQNVFTYAPTQQSVVQWMNETHGIFIKPCDEYNKCECGRCNGYKFCIECPKYRYRQFIYADTYEYALEQGIFEGLNLLV